MPLRGSNLGVFGVLAVLSTFGTKIHKNNYNFYCTGATPLLYLWHLFIYLESLPKLPRPAPVLASWLSR